MVVLKLIMLCIGILVFWSLSGMAVLSLYRPKDKKVKNYFGSALLFGAGITMAVFLFLVYIALKRQESFSFVYKIYGIGMLVLTLVSVLALVCRHKGRTLLKEQLTFFAGKENRRRILLLVCLYLLIACTFFVHRPLLEDRFDLPERLSTMAASDVLSGINPLTGASMETGTIFEMWKAASLPAFYLCLMKVSGLALFDVLFKAVPLLVLCLCMCAYWEIAAGLFGRDGIGRLFFMLAFALVTLCGNGAYMNPSYGLLHYAYEETTLISSVALPCVFALVLNIFKE